MLPRRLGQRQGSPQLTTCPQLQTPRAPCRQAGLQEESRHPRLPTRAPPTAAPGTHMLTTGPSSSPSHTPCLPVAASLHSPLPPQVFHCPDFSPNPCHFCRLVRTRHTPPPVSRVHGTLHTVLNSYLWNCVLSVCLSWRAVTLSHSACRTCGCPANCC